MRTTSRDRDGAKARCLREGKNERRIASRPLRVFARSRSLSAHHAWLRCPHSHLGSRSCLLPTPPSPHLAIGVIELLREGRRVGDGRSQESWTKRSFQRRQ